MCQTHGQIFLTFIFCSHIFYLYSVAIYALCFLFFQSFSFLFCYLKIVWFLFIFSCSVFLLFRVLFSASLNRDDCMGGLRFRLKSICTNTIWKVYITMENGMNYIINVCPIIRLFMVAINGKWMNNSLSVAWDTYPTPIRIVSIP